MTITLAIEAMYPVIDDAPATKKNRFRIVPFQGQLICQLLLEGARKQTYPRFYVFRLPPFFIRSFAQNVGIAGELVSDGPTINTMSVSRASSSRTDGRQMIFLDRGKKHKDHTLPNGACSS